MEILIQAYDCTVAVRCQSEETLARVEPYLLPTFARRGGTADATIEVSLDADIVDVVRQLDDAVIPRLKRFAVVHAGVVSIGNRTLLLPGRSHAGKSTLVAALLKRGAGYFSDEYALIDAKGQVHPYPRAMLLRRPHQVATLPDRFGEGRAAIGWILSLTYVPDGVWTLSPIPQSEGLLTLLRNTPQVLAEKQGILDALGRVSAGARCFAGVRGDAEDSAHKIWELFHA